MVRQHSAIKQPSFPSSAEQLLQPSATKTPRTQGTLVSTTPPPITLGLKVRPVHASRDSPQGAGRCAALDSSLSRPRAYKPHISSINTDASFRAVPAKLDSPDIFEAAFKRPATGNGGRRGASFSRAKGTSAETVLSSVSASRNKKTSFSRIPLTEEKAQQGLGQVVPALHNHRVYIAHNNETPFTIAAALGIHCGALISENVEVFGPALRKNSKLRKFTQLWLPPPTKQRETQEGATVNSSSSSGQDELSKQLLIVIKTHAHSAEATFPSATACIVDDHGKPSSEKLEAEAAAVSSATSDPDAADALSALLMLTRAPARPAEQPEASLPPPPTGSPSSSLHLKDSNTPRASNQEALPPVHPPFPASKEEAISLARSTSPLPHNPVIPSRSPTGALPPACEQKDAPVSRQGSSTCAGCLNRAQESARGKSTHNYIGVSFHRKTSLWWSFIRVDSRLKHIGDFRTEFEAAIAYDEHAARLGKALNRPKPPTVCSQCGKAPPSVVQCLPPALPPPPVPKPFANSKSPSPPPESSSSSTSAVFRPVNVENGENKKDDNASKRPLQVTVAHACSNEGPTHSFPALPSSAKFFVLKSDRVKRLYRVIAREGTDAQVEAISGPASGGVFRRAATASAPQWVDMMDVLEFSPKASSSSVPKQSAAQHKPLPGRCLPQSVQPHLALLIRHMAMPRTQSGVCRPQILRATLQARWIIGSTSWPKFA